jgi:hypothetical protein
VATISSLVDRVRVELGDVPKSFVTQFMADGTTNRFKLHYSPLDATTVVVYKNNVDISDECSIEESSGILVTETLPNDGDEFTVSGTYYRYFTGAELAQVITSAVDMHSAKHTDSLGRKITIDTLPYIDEYPVVVYATALALYTLATDASFDINIFAPDGVTIPRSERYRQLLDMMNTRKSQYAELCAHLGIGLYSIDVFTLRRISKRTNRYVPVYKPMEVDDRSWPQRVNLPLPAYGDAQPAWPTEGGPLNAYQGIAYEEQISFTGDFTGKTIIARLLAQRGSVQVVRDFTLEVTTEDDENFVANISLTAEETIRPPRRTHWQIASKDDVTGEIIEILGGDFFIQRRSEVIL